MEDFLIPLFGIVFVIGLPIFGGIIVSYMLIKGRHAERMAMIQNGMSLQELNPEKRPNRYPALRNGIFMIGLAVGLLVGIWVHPYIPIVNEWLDITIPTMALLFGGIAFVVYFFLSRYLLEKEAKEDLDRF